MLLTHARIAVVCAAALLASACESTAEAWTIPGGVGRLQVGSANTCINVYPSLCQSEITSKAPLFATFTQPTLPNSTGDFVEVSTMAALETQCESDGKNIRVTGNITTVGTALNGCLDTTIEIANGVQVAQIQLLESARVRIYGAGATSALQQLNIGTGDSTDIVLDSVVMPNDTTGAMIGRLRVSGTCTRCAIVSVVALGGNFTDGTDGFGTSPYVGLLNNVTDLLIANSNFGAPSNSGVNDWGFRLDPGTRVIVVDSMVQNKSGHGTFRDNAIVTDALFLRIKSVNLNSCRAFSKASAGWDDAYIVDSNIYLDNLVDTGNTYHPNSDYFFTDVAWHSDAAGGCLVSAASLTTDETGAGVPAGQYRGGSPTYDSSNSHPGWPVITSARGFNLDADADGSDDGNPYEL